MKKINPEKTIFGGYQYFFHIDFFQYQDPQGREAESRFADDATYLDTIALQMGIGVTKPGQYDFGGRSMYWLRCRARSIRQTASMEKTCGEGRRFSMPRKLPAGSALAMKQVQCLSPRGAGAR